MTPLSYITATLVVTGGAWFGCRLARSRRRGRLRELAREVEMHYAPGDRFNLAAAVASRFPTTGIADPAISDVLYCRRASRYFYVFRFEYTVGAMGPRRRRRAIVGFMEPRDAEHQGAVTLQVAAESGSEESRYRSLLGSCGVD